MLEVGGWNIGWEDGCDLPCCHPNICNAFVLNLVLLQDYGNPERSGKMHVLVKVLCHWHQQGHK